MLLKKKPTPAVNPAIENFLPGRKQQESVFTLLCSLAAHVVARLMAVALSESSKLAENGALTQMPVRKQNRRFLPAQQSCASRQRSRSEAPRHTPQSLPCMQQPPWHGRHNSLQEPTSGRSLGRRFRASRSASSKLQTGRHVKAARGSAKER